MIGADQQVGVALTLSHAGGVVATDIIERSQLAVFASNHHVGFAQKAVGEIVARVLHLAGVADTVAHNDFLLRATVDGYEFTVFPDNRAIIKGTDDVEKARTLYAKYIGY